MTAFEMIMIATCSEMENSDFLPGPQRILRPSTAQEWEVPARPNIIVLKELYATQIMSILTAFDLVDIFAVCAPSEPCAVIEVGDD